ncbi:MAG: prolyl oligopeptidase family serine peptidase [Armatimonadota bacterium]
MNRQGVLFSGAVLALGAVAAAVADGPADNIPEKVRPVPPPGISVPDADRTALTAGLTALQSEIDALRGNARAAAWLPDVQIYTNAVRYALENGEFFAPADLARAKALLAIGTQRAQALREGRTPWLEQPGPTALGYVSEIDGSVQPYGLYIPASYQKDGRKHRLDTWFHGRGETLSEVNFLDGVHKNGGPFVRPDTFTLQPYGRYCNANKLAGEVDLFEALADAQRRFRIDEERIVVRGFSMGGAACWQFAAHFPSEWAAAAPGAGFSETPDFLKVFQKETLQPTWWEKKLWQMYDCPEYAANFGNLPVVAYSGEKDSQKQAADIMAAALKKEGIELVHVIGPDTGHSYHPASSVEINRRIDAIAERGRVRVPRTLKLQTPTLKYHRQAWVTVDGLKEHWEPARVEAEIVDDRNVRLTTRNLTGVTLSMGPGDCPLDPTRAPVVTLDGQKLKAAPVLSDRSWTASFRRDGSRWVAGALAEQPGLRKRHDLQGPIDDAFMQSFMMVRPTGTPAAPGVAKWVESEMAHAEKEWRRQFRGEARVKNDSEITDADIAAHNLVLWGDPGSNRILARIADRLPIRWGRSEIEVGSQRFPTSTHAPVLIYPNPLNPKKYVVLNSGFTFREYDYLNNARQVPKLPDWAIVDTTTPPNSRYPGRIVTADFFGEQWELRPPRKS